MRMRLLFLVVALAGTHAMAKKPPKKAPPAAAPAAAPQAEATPATMLRPARLDFTDPQLIQGQTNTAGSVYLYERKELKNRSMVKLREDFRDEISL